MTTKRNCTCSTLRLGTAVKVPDEAIYECLCCGQEFGNVASLTGVSEMPTHKHLGELAADAAAELRWAVGQLERDLDASINLYAATYKRQAEKESK